MTDNMTTQETLESQELRLYCFTCDTEQLMILVDAWHGVPTYRCPICNDERRWLR